MCWNGIIHTLTRSTGSLLQRVGGDDPSWVAASAVVRGRRASLKHRPTLSQSIFPSLTLSLSPSGSCAFLAAAARCECVCIHGQEYLRVCDCWNPPCFSLCVICKSAQQLLSWHYAVCLHTHIFLMDFIKTPSAVSLHTQQSRGRNKTGNYFSAISLKTSCSGSIAYDQHVHVLCGLTRPCVCLSMMGKKSHWGKGWEQIFCLSLQIMQTCIPAYIHTQSGWRVLQCCTGAAWALAGPSIDSLMVI